MLRCECGWWSTPNVGVGCDRITWGNTGTQAEQVDKEETEEHNMNDDEEIIKGMEKSNEDTKVDEQNNDNKEPIEKNYYDDKWGSLEESKAINGDQDDIVQKVFEKERDKNKSKKEDTITKIDSIEEENKKDDKITEEINQNDDKDIIKGREFDIIKESNEETKVSAQNYGSSELPDLGSYDDNIYHTKDNRATKGDGEITDEKALDKESENDYGKNINREEESHTKEEKAKGKVKRIMEIP